MSRKKAKLDIRWTEDQLSLLGDLSDAEVAERTGRTANAVALKRCRMGIPNWKSSTSYDWEDWEIKLLGTAPDWQVAKELGVSRRTVLRQRHQRGIPAHGR